MSPKQTPHVPPEKITALSDRYRDLEEAIQRVQTAIERDAMHCARFIPTFGTTQDQHTSIDALKAASHSLTRLYLEREAECPTQYGLICASPNTIEHIEALNLAKSTFKKVILEIRAVKKSRDAASASIQKLIEQEVTDKGFRTPQLTEAMHNRRLTGLDLKRCYAKIRVLPPDLEMLSWTWATNHYRSQKLTREKAIALAEKLPTTSRQTALDKLKQAGSNEEFVRKVPLPNQLRCNYATLDGERASTPVSGVLIAQQSSLPLRMKWRDDPGEQEAQQVARRTSLEPKMYIKALRLYRYAR